jgi:hypothetical protein
MSIHRFRHCISVKKLREILKDWPDTDSCGEASEVWIETGRNLSSPVLEVSQLNETDILLGSLAFEEGK